MTRVWTNDSNTHDLCTHSLSSRVDRKDHSPTLTNLLGWEIEYLIWFKQTHSANSCDFGDGQPVVVQDKVWWAHVHLGSTIKTRFDQDKIKDCKGQTNWRPTGGAYWFPVGLFGDLGKFLCFHHIIIWVDEYSELVDMFVGCGGYPNPT